MLGHNFCNIKENGRRHDVHHIDYDKKNCDQSNLITLCRTHNMEVNGNRDFWQPYFEEIITMDVV